MDGRHRDIKCNDRDHGDARRDAEAARKERLDKALDSGLEETFPASDPVSVTQPPHSAYDRNGAPQR
jgi:hypothetical protein